MSTQGQLKTGKNKYQLAETEHRASFNTIENNMARGKTEVIWDLKTQVLIKDKANNG